MSMAAQPLTAKIFSRIYNHKRGWVFTPIHFRDLGTDLAIRKALQTLHDEGRIKRLERGLYIYPEIHAKLGQLLPTPDQIALALAGKDDLRIQPSGAYAANLLGLSEQVQAKIVFLTDGLNRKIKVGNQEIQLRRTTPKNMATAGRTSGLVIQALRYLGQNHVDDETIKKLARRLTSGECRKLMADIRYAPAWIGAIFRRLAEGADCGG